ncbi:MAG TPA: GntR family transcriptional regulator [Clostridium sp.]|uniref:GntR family transcriptional regulator n=1 Tax=Clostridium sp. TaxID=1506 RepID=UPI002F91C3B2
MGTKTEHAYQIIKKKIMEGEYKPSENLNEVNLANAIVVSRNTIKKALLMLASEGLVDVQENKGAKVKSFTLEEVINYLQVREVLEGLVAELTAPIITDEELNCLGETLLKMEACIKNNDLVQYSNYNLHFHNIIYTACKNKQAVQLINSIKTQVLRYHFRTILVPGRNMSSLQEHKNIYNALKAHDVLESGRFIKIHISNVRDILTKNYQFLI